ncbi:hypothetical protein GPECTOR_20g588 [Gonium pectorale]|uniref:Uncharacterized protein n=1 Tax=Gonium pectorale TaxID=33097 RepID=A0A150GIT9_GONPE|nr:hypothetical protein GPECTOR_20g588 [Gonium pectorale]|eukprot:KXZ49731.1 hypothetical protein GPECTOR_20g588 [Gonium pectorale]
MVAPSLAASAAHGRQRTAQQIVWPQLLPELAERIVGCLDHNHIAATFRRISKTTAAHFSGPLHATIHLSEPVPPHAFAAHWLTPGATRGLTLVRRRKLVRLVAASGVLPNLEVALQAVGYDGAVGGAFEAAAGAGQLLTCQWLWNHRRNRECDQRIARFALTPAADFKQKAALLSAAAGSPTPDWAAKVEWLEAQGCPRSSDMVMRAANLPDDVAAAGAAGRGALFQSCRVGLLAWLRERGCRWDCGAYSAAANAGCEAALEWLAQQGCPMQSVDPPPYTAQDSGGVPYIKACANGDLATARCLRRLGVPWGPAGSVFLGAAKGYGYLPNAPLPLLRWLLEEGCPVDYEAVEAGMVEWDGRPPWTEEVLALLREHLGRRQA